MMCAKADRCGTFTLPLPLPFTFTLLWTDYGDDGTCHWYCYCCLLFVDDDVDDDDNDDDDVLLLAAAVAAAYIGRNITCTLPYLR